MDAGELSKAFGIVVRRERTERGYSQEGFADHTGVHRTYMGLVERGKNTVTIFTAYRIAVALSLPLSRLMALTESELGSGRK